MLGFLLKNACSPVPAFPAAVLKIYKGEIQYFYAKESGSGCFQAGVKPASIAIQKRFFCIRG